MTHANKRSAKTEIVKQLGYLPAFLIPAINSSLIFRSLAQQTLSAYINNPFPDLFKEKLFVSLSRYCGISYFTICHSCTLQSLGMKASEILALGDIEYPQTEEDIKADLQLLCDQWQGGREWQNNPQIETSLLRCSSLIFLQPTESANCSAILKPLLGKVYYNYLIVFLGYIRLCHQWVRKNPEISHQQDRRSQLHLGSLLLTEIRLAQFFQPNIKPNVKPEISQQETAIPTTFQAKNCSSSFSRISPKLNPATFDWQLRQKTVISCLANAPFPVMIHNQDGKILHLNRHWLDVTGYSAPEITTISEWKQKAQVQQQEIVKLSTGIPQRLVAYNPQTQSSQVVTDTEAVLQQIVVSLTNLTPGMTEIAAQKKIAKATRSEVTITTSNDEQRFWELYSAPLSFDNDSHQLTISIVKDVTEIVRSETKLAEVETKLKLVLEATKTGNWSWNLLNNRVEICHRGRTILGLRDFDGSYESFLQSINPSERESVDLAAIKAIKAQKDLDLEYRIVNPDHETCWIRARGKLYYNAEGQAARITGVVTDITQQKNIQARVDSNINQFGQPNLVKSLQKLETLLNLIPYYLFVVDVPTQTISLVNVGLAQSLGLSKPEAVKGQTISECFSSEYTRQIVWQEQQVLSHEKVLHLQEEVVLPDGIHYFDTVITPIRNDQGEIYAVLHTSSDIPDLVATQEALSERTLQLEAANRELESFSYSVSHDLQAPLRVINGFSQVLWENYQPCLDDRGKHYLQRIQANSKRMSDLIDALLQLSRVTRSQMESVNVNLSAIALDIVEELQTESPQRQIEVKIEPDLQVKGDPQLLRIVLDNLLNNSWKYTSKRSLSQIEFNVLPGDQPQSTYFVRDNGAGFDLQYADKLFTPFQRLHSQLEFPGTGIGLATVQRIIYRHGGKVWAEGECDRGATIYFSL